MSDYYPLIKLIHILSSTVLFGTGLGTAFQMWVTNRSGDVRAIAQTAQNVVWADWLFTTPAIVVQPATGLLLINAAGYGLWEPWLMVAYALYAIAGACWMPVVWIQLQLRDLARAAATGAAPLPVRYHRLMAWWFWLGWPAFSSVVAIFWLMVTKPVF
ncbi:MAG: DUF2269 domain-containing protein [Alphaproteobacteria bacterium]|nr:DUF2269 domain-containing protein [Alphaproteobacteria bacterium]MBL6940036.1 DUF2269 domain-containing protein [Alphaproteobacteria bacterium]MBL7098108.1 DUF2269 domain-containing protein [Alphaproteobacteria bacterium]